VRILHKIDRAWHRAGQMKTSASNFVDLHCHSTASDGTYAPAAVLRLAAERKLSALALTDHDTVDGIAEASGEAARLGIDFVPGIEISAEFPHPGTLHILGYGADPELPVLRDLTKTLLAGRDNRNPRIIAKLQELKVSITMDEVEAEAGGNVVGRPHIAAILVRKGYVGSMQQAFDKYLAPGGLAYFDKERLSPKQALQMILDSGGLPVLAHPVQLRTENDAQLERIVKDLVDLGLAGVEVIHSDHDAKLVAKYEALADRYKLLKTGGSDFHGNNKPIELGTANGRRVPRAYFDALLEALCRRGKAGVAAVAQDTRHVV
jgi:3',5'-nucleoside bisphosphate phosphatase